MSALSELALQMHRMIWYPVHVALGLESPGIILPDEFAPSLSDPLRDDLPRRRRKARRSRITFQAGYRAHQNPPRGRSPG